MVKCLRGELKYMDKKLIYIADDEVNIRNIIRSFLIKDGFEVDTFSDGGSIFQAFSKKPADMLIIDIMMPEIDGYSLCSLIRQKSNVPIIFVSAKDTESDKIAGLTLGGDDYLTKPFSPMELIARMKSIFRRIEASQIGMLSSEIINIADISINADMKQAMIADKNIGLTGMEFSLLHYLINNRNRAVGRGELLENVWGFDIEVSTRATDDMIKRMRKKLSDAGSILKIDTVRGFGFTIQNKE